MYLQNSCINEELTGLPINETLSNERIEQVHILGVESLGKREGKGCKRCCVHDPSPVLLSGT
jgi:hypothetical protein